MDFILRLRLVRANSGSQIKQIAHQQVPKRKATILLTRTEVPDYYDPNPYIHTGYRPESRSLWLSLASWTYLHNETCNIYSHLIPGVLLLLGQGLLYLHVRGESSTRIRGRIADIDHAILALHLFTAACCLLLSAFYHTLSNHSQDVAHRWLQLDYLGILNLILGNFISGLHFGFYCEPALKYFYWGLVRYIHFKSLYIQAC